MPRFRCQSGDGLRVSLGVVVLLSVAIVAVLVASPVSDAESAESTTVEQDGVLYELDDEFKYNRSAAVIGAVDGFDVDRLEIPSEVSYGGNDYRVSGIRSGAFEGLTGLVSVDLPQSVSSIGARAFAGCTSLTDINIPARVTELRDTFVGCTSLESIILTGNYYVTTLSGTFQGCVSLRDVAIRWMAEVGEDTFNGCESLVNVDTGHILVFGDRSFMGCSSLERLDVGEGVSRIGDSAFAGCASLTSVDIQEPDDLVVGADAFADCPSLTSVSIGDGVRSIGDSAFAGCASLSHVTFLDSSCDVGRDVFLGCDGMSSVHVRSPEVLGQLHLGDGLTSLTLGGDITDVTGSSIPALPDLRTLVLEDGVRSIGDGAFGSSHGLELIAVPGSVTTVGASAFDVPGSCLVAGQEGCLDSSGVAVPRYGGLISYEVTGRPDVADHRSYGWAEPGDVVVPEVDAVGGCTVSVSLDGADVLDGFTMPSGDVTVAVAYDDGQRVVMYYDRNILIAYYWVHLGDRTPVPEDPCPAPLERYSYEFMGWDELSPGDVVTGSASYNSEYRLLMTGYSGAEMENGFLEFDDRLDFPLYLSEDVANSLIALSLERGAEGVSFSFADFNTMWMTLEVDDLVRIDGTGLTIGVSTDVRNEAYTVTVEGTEGVTVDVDLPWMTSYLTTRVNAIDEDGGLESVESESAWHSGHFVRFTVDGSGDYQTYNDGLSPRAGSLIVLGVFVVLAAAAVIFYSGARDEDGS